MDNFRQQIVEHINGCGIDLAHPDHADMVASLMEKQLLIKDGALATASGKPVREEVTDLLTSGGPYSTFIKDTSANRAKLLLRHAAMLARPSTPAVFGDRPANPLGSR